MAVEGYVIVAHGTVVAVYALRDELALELGPIRAMSAAAASSSKKGVGGKGWRGDRSWRDAVRRVEQGGTIEDLNGTVPTLQEGMDLIDEAGGKVIRVEGPHESPNPHTFDHINYETATGQRGTLRIQR